MLQAAGGALSTTQKAGDRTGVHISMAGLILQVIVIVIFMACFADYMVRLLRSGRGNAELRAWRSVAFFAGLVAACIFILTRCAYRVAELKDGYTGHLFRDQTTFIVLEGCMVVLAGVSLMFGNPGLVLDKQGALQGGRMAEKQAHSDSDGATMTGEHRASV